MAMFEEVLGVYKEGKEIRRRSWESYKVIEGEGPKVTHVLQGAPEGIQKCIESRPFLNQLDLLADDWEVATEDWKAEFKRKHTIYMCIGETEYRRREKENLV